MKIKILILLFLSILFLQTCAEVKVASVASKDQKTDYNGAIVSEKKHVVSVSYYEEIDMHESYHKEIALSDFYFNKSAMCEGKTMFRIVIVNRGKEKIKISRENISVIFNGKSEAWKNKKIEIQSLDDFIYDLDKNFFYNENRSIYNVIKKYENKIPGDFERILKLLNNGIEAGRKQFKQLIISVKKIYLECQTIIPGSVYNGVIACDTGEMTKKITGKFQVVILIDGEEYEFMFLRILE